jgi:PAS domain S-box-containing protein
MSMAGLAVGCVSDHCTMELSEHQILPPGREGKIIEALALALDISISMYDRNDKLIAGSSRFQRFFKIPSELLVPGTRLRDILGAVYDTGAIRFGSLNGKARVVSRDDWIAERIATNWRERHEGVEQLVDGRWVRFCKRRMPDGVLVSTIADVSEQMRRDAELSETRQQAELAQHILDNLATPVMVKDSALRYVTVNEAFCRIPGLHPKHLIGRSAKDLVNPELAAKFEAIERKVLDTGVPHEAVEDITRRDGSTMRAVTRIHRSGTPGNHYLTVTFDDIGEYARSENNAAAAGMQSGNKAPQTCGQKDVPERILVLEADRSRGEHRVAALKAAGSDAMAICHAADAIAFVAEAERMQIRIDRIELCDAMAARLASHEKAARHQVLVDALKIWSEAAAKRQASSTGHDDAQAVELPRQAAPRIQPARVAPDPVPEPVEADTALSSAPASETKIEPASSKTPDRLRVLVAEDNHVNQIVFEQILEGIDADYRIVCNGEEALAAWRASAPDLILMDVSMPVMNGLQATQAIRKAEHDETGHKSRTPIIAVTAHAMGGDKERCLSAGMDDYLSKPVSPDRLEAIIAKWVARSNDYAADSGACRG